jgi:hypothetical protein
MLCEC